MPKRIMIIDDEDDVLEILSLVFEDEGYNVITANNGDAAEHILEYNPDVILLDLRLVGSKHSGLEICRALKSNPSTAHVPVILISSEYNLPKLASACGADDYITKPFDLEGVTNKVRSRLG